MTKEDVRSVHYDSPSSLYSSQLPNYLPQIQKCAPCKDFQSRINNLQFYRNIQQFFIINSNNIIQNEEVKYSSEI